MEWILIAAVVVWLLSKCDNVSVGEAAYERFRRLYPGISCPSWFDRDLKQREAHLDQEIQGFEKYLADYPTPPKDSP